MTEPPETAGKPNTVDCDEYIRQWAIESGYPLELPANFLSVDELLEAIKAWRPE